MKATFWAGMAVCLCLIFVIACEDQQVEPVESPQPRTLQVAVRIEHDTLAYLPGDTIMVPGYAELTHGNDEPYPGVRIQLTVSNPNLTVEYQDSRLRDTTNSEGLVNFRMRLGCGHGPEVIQAAAMGLFAVDTIHLWDCGPGWH